MSKSQSVFYVALLGLSFFPSLACSPVSSGKPGNGPVTITYWEKWTGFEGDAIKATVDNFNQSQNRIFVKLVTVSEIQKKLLIATAGGDPPDVSGIYSHNVQVYADKGALMPLDEGLKKCHVNLGDFIPIYLKECYLRDHIYALPIACMTVALHYNKDHFKAAGLDPNKPPRTIQELEQYAEKLTIKDNKGGYKQMGFLPTEPGWWNWAWVYWLGGSIYDYKTHSITAYSPENLRAMKWFWDFSGKYGVQQVSVYQSGFGTFSSPQNAFLAGKISMVLQGVWMHNYIQTFNPKLHWGVAPFPAFSKKVHDVTLIESDVVVIPRGCPHPEEAFQFLAYLTSTKGNEMLNLGQLKFPVLKKVTAGFWKKNSHPYLKNFRKLADSPCAFTSPRMGLFEAYMDEEMSAFNQVWLHQKTPEEALREVQARMDKQWQKELKRFKRLGLQPPD